MDATEISHSYCLIVFLVSWEGMLPLPSSLKTRFTSSQTAWKVFRHVSLLLPANLPIWSKPVKACIPSIVRWYLFPQGVQWLVYFPWGALKLQPLYIIQCVSFGRSQMHRTRTCLSGDHTSNLVTPSHRILCMKYNLCNSLFVGALQVMYACTIGHYRLVMGNNKSTLGC